MKDSFWAIICFVVTFSFCGCEPETPVVADPGPKTIEEFVTDAAEQSEEIKFCVADGAGKNSLTEPLARVQNAIAALPDLISQSTLTEIEKSKLGDALQTVTALCDKTAQTVASGNERQTLKVSSELAKQFKAMQKLVK